MSVRPVPEKERQEGPEIKPVGEWVMEAPLFPGAGENPDWRGYIQEDKDGKTTTYGERDRS